MARKAIGMIAAGMAFAVLTANAATPVPPGERITVTAETESKDGVARLPKIDGYTEFTATAVNKGESRTISVKAETGIYPIPVALTVCRTGPAGHCLSKPAPSITLNFFYGKTLTFKVGVRGQDNLPPMAADRVDLNFYDNTGALVGGTHVALDDGSIRPNAKSLPGIYSIAFETPAHPGYDLDGTGTLVVSPTGAAYALTQSGILIYQATNLRKGILTTEGSLWPYTNNILRDISNASGGFISLTAANVPEHWIAGQYQLTGGRVSGFEYGTAQAIYRKSLYERGSSGQKIKGLWRIRYRVGGPIVGTMTLDQAGNVSSKVKNCQLDDGWVIPIDPKFNIYQVKFASTDVSGNDFFCRDLQNSSGVAAMFDTTSRNDTLHLFFNGQNGGYSWILNRH